MDVPNKETRRMILSPRLSIEDSNNLNCPNIQTSKPKINKQRRKQTNVKP